MLLSFKASGGFWKYFSDDEDGTCEEAKSKDCLGKKEIDLENMT